MKHEMQQGHQQVGPVTQVQRLEEEGRLASCRSGNLTSMLFTGGSAEGLGATGGVSGSAHGSGPADGVSVLRRDGGLSSVLDAAEEDREEDGEMAPGGRRQEQW